MTKQNPSLSLPDTIASEQELEILLSTPTDGVKQVLASLDGDLMFLGAGGKMGPTLSKMAKRAVDEAGLRKRIIAVSRFSTPELKSDLEQHGIETISCDLLDRSALESLPDAANVIYMAGRKFGSTGAEWYTWAMNSYLPGMAAERFRSSRIVAFSTGNVYPLTRICEGGSRESDAPEPVGEYAQSCLGRERMFQHFSLQNGTPVALIRLNYAVEMRYGILLDVAQKVEDGIPVHLTMGNVNVIWQGDANAYTLQALAYGESPPQIFNVAGPETVSIRRVAQRFGELLGKEPIFAGNEAETALLSNAEEIFSRFGYPQVSLGRIIRWVADWVKMGGVTHGKPTHYEEREGKF